MRFNQSPSGNTIAASNIPAGHDLGFASKPQNVRSLNRAMVKLRENDNEDGEHMG
jgi:hypothetical protein